MPIDDVIDEHPAREQLVLRPQLVSDAQLPQDPVVALMRSVPIWPPGSAAGHLLLVWPPQEAQEDPPCLSQLVSSEREASPLQGVVYFSTWSLAE